MSSSLKSLLESKSSLSPSAFAAGLARASFFTTDESAQYFECGYSCDHAILLKLDSGVDSGISAGASLESPRAESSKIFFTDSRYTTEAREHLQAGVTLIESSDLLESMIELLRKERVRELLCDSARLCVEDFNRLRENLPECTLHFEPNFHQHIRIIKSEQEIALIAKSQALNKQAYKAFAKAIESRFCASSRGLKELELHAMLRQELERGGKYDLSFNPIVGINANAAKPHALPCRDRLRDGDLLLVDAGVKYKRYCSDRTRTAVFSHGEIDFSKSQNFSKPKLQKIYDIVRKAQEHAIVSLRAGMSGKQIDALARDVIDKAGYGEYFSHSTGHGIGLDIHELPRISKSSEMIIEDGMVFSIEPGIYLPGKYGVRIEDLVVVRNGRAEVL